MSERLAATCPHYHNDRAGVEGVTIAGVGLPNHTTTYAATKLATKSFLGPLDNFREASTFRFVAAIPG